MLDAPLPLPNRRRRPLIEIVKGMLTVTFLGGCRFGSSSIGEPPLTDAGGDARADSGGRDASFDAGGEDASPGDAEPADAAAGDATADDAGERG